MVLYAWSTTLRRRMSELYPVAPTSVKTMIPPRIHMCSVSVSGNSFVGFVRRAGLAAQQRDNDADDHENRDRAEGLRHGVLEVLAWDGFGHPQHADHGGCEQRRDGAEFGSSHMVGGGWWVVAGLSPRHDNMPRRHQL